MASFGYPKYKLKTLEFAQQHFWIPNLFWVKINSIQWLNEEDWIQSNYTKYITYKF
jgi:hypothetical protein